MADTLGVTYPDRFSSGVLVISPTEIVLVFLMDKIPPIQMNILTNEVLGASIYVQLPHEQARIHSTLQKFIIGGWNLLPRHAEITSG